MPKKYKGQQNDGTLLFGHLVCYTSYGVNYEAILEDPTIESFADIADYNIIPETKALFSEMTDKSGNPLFQGDKVKVQVFNGDGRVKSDNKKGVLDYGRFWDANHDSNFEYLGWHLKEDNGDCWSILYFDPKKSEMIKH